MKDYSASTLIIQRARMLRRNDTLPESMLWGLLKKRKLLGLKFRRQFPIGNYILDFYCFEKATAIEIDGKSHDFDKQILQDIQKEKYLSTKGIRLIRITNQEVLWDLENIITWLKEELQ